MEYFVFAGGKPILVFVVSEHLKGCFLVNDFASERIHETDIVIHICADKWMRLVTAGQEFVDDYSFIDQIDPKDTGPQLTTPVFKIIWRADDGGNTMRCEVILQQNEFARCRQVLPIENRDIGHSRTA